MKKFKFLFVLLAIVLILPLSVFAEGEEEETSEAQEVDKRVLVYFFRGEGCPHCQEAEEWFDSIESEYGSKYRIVDYETWYNEDNADLMQRVSDARDDNATGVPYIIIGDKSWVGFAADTYGPEIKAQIDTVYEQEVSERYDALSLVGESAKDEEAKDGNGGDVVALIIILVVVALGCFGIYKARVSE